MFSKYNPKKTVDDHVDWFRPYDWQWFCTLTIRPGIRQAAIAQLFNDWINAIELDEGRKITWLRMIERGGSKDKFKGRLHIHALIAGTRLFTPQKAAGWWSDLAGGALIGPYDPESECLRYTLKSIEDGLDDAFDAALCHEHRLDPATLQQIEDDKEWL